MDNRFLGIIEESVKKHWDMPAFSDYRGDTFLYKDMARTMAEMHILFEAAGIQKGDKVALVGRNSSRWGITFFGVLSYGAVIVPVLHDFKSDNIHNIVNHSEAKALFAASGNHEHLDIAQMPGVSVFVRLDDFSILHASDTHIYNVWQTLAERFAAKFPGGFTPDCARFHMEAPEEPAVLNYTSGTTSSSKGVLLPYRSLWSNTNFAHKSLPFVHSGDNFVCMLPMAHMYGLAFELLNGVGKGCHIHFLPRIPSPKIVLEAMTAHKPILVLSVPLILEKIIRNQVFPKLRRQPLKSLIKVPGLKQLILKNVAGKLNKAFGEKFEEIVIGGAALNPEVEEFLHAIKFRYTVGYGLTECGPLVAYTQWDSFKPGSVGQIVDRMTVRIDSPNAEKVGEIWVKGHNNMLGYYKNPEGTAAVMRADGWMNTGDLGFIDDDGFLFIKGRSKTMILSSNGQNIYPEEIESVLNTLPFVLESLVISHEGKLLALIHPDKDKAEREALGRSALNGIMEENLLTLNRLMPLYSKVASFRMQDEEFEKTPKKSIKRYLYQPAELS
ncbi:MAG: AMP-binding protein [Tannerellaceae bacterium]|jgi:long-chain acyl-CoA synthetase|nr:AMP-binding protein [Tannerellaceae bacterium]